MSEVTKNALENAIAKGLRGENIHGKIGNDAGASTHPGTHNLQQPHDNLKVTRSDHSPTNLQGSRPTLGDGFAPNTTKK